MDDTDLRIIQLTGAGPFLGPPRRREDSSPAALAKQLGISVETVRRRLTVLRNQGTLMGRGMWPNLRHLGLTASSYHFRLSPDFRRGPAIGEVAALRGVLSIYEFVGNDVCVDIVHANETAQAKLVRLIQDHLGGAPAVAALQYMLPAPKRKLTPLDWRILQAMQENADRDLGEVAKELHVARRTVARRLDAMEAAGDVDVAGLFDPGRLEGHLMAYLLIRMTKGAGAVDRKTVLESLSGRWLAQWSAPDARFAHLVVVLAAKTTRELEDIRRETESLSHVERVEAMVAHCATPGPSWMEDAMEQKATGEPVKSLRARRLVTA